MITVTEKRFGEYHKDDIAVTLRNRSGTYGGGSEVLVVQSVRSKRETTRALEHSTHTKGS